MDMTSWVIIGVFFFMSYFIGSYPTGHLIGRFFANIEVQDNGSGKGGATNVMRTTKDVMLGLIVGAIDLGVKGAFWMCMVRIIFANLEWAAFICFAILLLGHVFPLLTNFKTGGAGVATVVGGAVAFAGGFAYLLAAVAWVLTFYLSKGIRALCNMAAVAVLLFSGVLFDFSWEFLAFAVFATGLVVFAHRSNIKRMRQGKEDRSRIRWKLF